MKATTTTITTNTNYMLNIDIKKAEKILKAYALANSSFMTIPEAIISKALENGDISKIAEHKSRKGNSNVYYEVNEDLIDNTVLVNVQQDYYILVNRYTYCPSKDNMVDTVGYMTKFSWCTGRTTSNRCHVMSTALQKDIEAGMPQTIYLTRLLTSLELDDDLTALDSSYDAHHKGDCFDNRQLMTMYIPKSEHKHRNNHMTGRKLKSYEDFMSFIASMKDSYEQLKNITTVS